MATEVAHPPAARRVVAPPRTAARIAAALGRKAELVPAFLWVLVLVLLPNAFLFVYSLWKSDLGSITHDWNLGNYRTVFGSDAFRVLLWRTLLIATVSAALATTVAYPLAFLVVRKFGRFKQITALAIIVPLWVSYLMRVFAWQIILGKSGVLNSVLTNLGIIHGASEGLAYSRTAVIITLAYVAIPFVFLSAYTALDRLPDNLFEASGDCGATGWKTFQHVVWPLTRPAVVVGFGIGFVLALGDYVTPSLVGGLNGTMLGSLVIQQFGDSGDWPLGAAIGMTILATGLVFLAIVSFFTRMEARFE